MKNKIKLIIFIISLSFNVIFILLLVLSSGVKISNFVFPAPDNNSASTAVIINFPKTASAVINLIELNLAPNDTAFIQYSYFSAGKQSNFTVEALYDPKIISVIKTNYGIEILAIQKGTTLIQTITNEGIKDIAFISVE